MSEYKKTNPIIPKGCKDPHFSDPHIKLFRDNETGKERFYMYCGRDYGTDRFELRNWYVLITDDMVEWEYRKVLDSGDTYLGEGADNCWACDVVQNPKDKKYYLYYSAGDDSTGVAVSETPEGPFKDANQLKPVLYSELTPTTEYDPDVVMPEEEGDAAWIFFGSPKGIRQGADDYWAVQLQEDMVSVNPESTTKIYVYRSEEEKEELDVELKSDQPEIFKKDGVFYLYWAGRYAVSDKLLGPYYYRGNLGKNRGSYPDGRVFIDHGSFLQWKNQWFYAVTEGIPNPLYRKSYLLYLHFCDDGSLMIDEKIKEYGVGQYDAGWKKIQAEWYMEADAGLEKREFFEGEEGNSFAVFNKEGSHTLRYPNVYNMPENARIIVRVKTTGNGGMLAVYEDSAERIFLGEMSINKTKDGFEEVEIPLKNTAGKLNLCFELTGEIGLDWFRIL